MDDHEQVHADALADADRLEDRSEHLEQEIEHARETRDAAAADDFIAHEQPESQSTQDNDQPIGDLTDVGDSQGDDGPPPEATYTSKR